MFPGKIKVCIQSYQIYKMASIDVKTAFLFDENLEWNVHLNKHTQIKFGN